ncbi:3'(2'),5'-bisphosphate nucleotidase CysQ [Aliikangiella marina]|uniref:3'(2'),5'-bisphosphate nucleotidase CysQ n=1 Tax=Aliikangiella marina TaxID=1712262 RepID=A0A545T9N8_9GAMM|nr:3'(2'),5'-bisphosphate nucleotidase CysQ [Aliikangiella marina]TQV73931.1 3'(2'),5'-bisphosphate nucleotidase CysQ [Aliikangiella marina]
MSLLEYPINDILKVVKQTALDAGDAIMEIYQSDDFDVQLKGDESPLTKADLAAHNVIIDALEKSFPAIPCLSEESKAIAFEERQKWDHYFIIDPLDGTKEFIARNDEFTVNIALIENGQPVLGVIYAPVLKTLYFAADTVGAYKQVDNQEPHRISVRKLQQKEGQNHFTVVASRRHGLDKVETMCQNFASYDLTSRGSSLKMCLVAEGAADLYPRLALTSEWDTAAAQSIVEHAGGMLVELDFSAMQYNQKESLLNPFFLVLGDPSFDWKKELVIPNLETNT